MKYVMADGAIEIPSDWEDRTTHQFVSPPPPGLDAPLGV